MGCFQTFSRRWSQFHAVGINALEPAESDSSTLLTCISSCPLLASPSSLALRMDPEKTLSSWTYPSQQILFGMRALTAILEFWNWIPDQLTFPFRARMGTSSLCSPKLSLIGVLLNRRVPLTSSISSTSSWRNIFNFGAPLFCESIVRSSNAEFDLVFLCTFLISIWEKHPWGHWFFILILRCIAADPLVKKMNTGWVWMNY